MLAYAWYRSRGFPIVAAACLVSALAGAFAADVTLRLPLLPRSLPLPVIVVLVVTLVMTTPLCNRFGSLETSLARAPLDRAMAGVVACGLAMVACLPASISAGAKFPWSLLLALMTVAVLAVIMLGPLAWLPTTVLGLTTIYVDLVYRDPIRSTLDALGLPTLTIALGVSLAGFIARGPRNS